MSTRNTSKERNVNVKTSQNIQNQDIYMHMSKSKEVDSEGSNITMMKHRSHLLINVTTFMFSWMHCMLNNQEIENLMTPWHVTTIKRML